MIPDEAIDDACLAMNDGVRSSHYRERWEDEVRFILEAAAPAIHRQVLTDAIEGIRAEDWWTPEGGSEYELGDNDGKVRVIGWLDDRIAEIDGAE